MAEDQRERLEFLKRISIFRGVMHADLLALAGTLQRRVFPLNAVVAREGTDADELFLIKPLISIFKLISILLFLGHLFGCFFYYLYAHMTPSLPPPPQPPTWAAARAHGVHAGRLALSRS